MRHLALFVAQLQSASLAGRIICTVHSRAAAALASPPPSICRGCRLLSGMSGDPSTKASAPSPKKRKRTKRQQASPPRATASVDSDEHEWFHKFTQGDPLYADYMTNEWGREKDTDAELFEKLSLEVEGAQSGLSWRTILHKREAYRRAFHGFDIDKVAAMTAGEIDALMSKTADDPKELVVRHRGKLASVLNNAQIIQQLIADGTIDSFKEYLWSFVDHKPIMNRWASFHDLPGKTEESERMSKELKKRGFKFVGPTTCYAMMQSCGFVIDHPVGTKHWVEAEERLKGRNGGYQGVKNGVAGRLIFSLQETELD